MKKIIFLIVILFNIEKLEKTADIDRYQLF